MKYTIYFTVILLALFFGSCQKYFGEFQTGDAGPPVSYSLFYPSDFEYHHNDSGYREWGRGFYRRDRGRLQFVYDHRIRLGTPSIATKTAGPDSLSIDVELNGESVRDSLFTAQVLIYTPHRRIAMDSTDASGRTRLQLVRTNEPLRLAIRMKDWEILDIPISHTEHSTVQLPIQTDWGTQFKNRHAYRYLVRSWTRDTVELREEYPREGSMTLVRVAE